MSGEPDEATDPDERRVTRSGYLAGKLARDPSLVKLAHAYLSAVELGARRIIKASDLAVYPEVVKLGAETLIDRVVRERGGASV